MKYRNRETGSIIEVTSKLKGPWEPLEAPKASADEPKVAPVQPEETKKKVRKASK